MQSSKNSILSKLSKMLAVGESSAPPASTFVNPFAASNRRGRDRTPGPRRPAGSKLAGKVAKRRLYNPIH